MKLEFEYGHGLMSANLPDNTDVFIPGVTVPDPECLPQDWDSLYNATLESIRNPYGMPALKELAAPGKTVVFVIPDIVKGGCQPGISFFGFIKVRALGRKSLIVPINVPTNLYWYQMESNLFFSHGES